ncbi:amidohydrolase [Bdellovibrionota bacterium FG-2]
MKVFDLAVRCDFLLTLEGGKSDCLRDQVIGICGSTIDSVFPWADGLWKTPWRAKEFIYAKDQVVLPGLVNAHTHLPMSLFRGLADDLPFNDWLYKAILPAESKQVDAEFVRVGTRLAALESIQSGVTTVCDMYYFENIVAEELEKAGLRAVVGEAVTDFPAPDDKFLKGEKYKILAQLVERYQSSKTITPCVAPHAPYTCSDETIQKAVKFASRHQLSLMLHVSETLPEIHESLKKYAKTPVQRLHDLGVMSSPHIFAHCTHVTDDDIELMARAHTGIAYNPESNMKLGAGVAPFSKLVKAGIAVGVGTDGAASNKDLSILRECDTAAKIQKLSQSNNTAMTASDALRAATIEGARALGLDKVTGSLEPGKFADLICIDVSTPQMIPHFDLPSLLVYSSAGMGVKTVVCHGEILLEEGMPKTLDSKRICADALAYQQLIQASITL